MPAYSYTPGEIAWLLSLNGVAGDERLSGAQQARQLDVESLERTGNWGAGDESGIPVIARWHDVRRARRELQRSAADSMLAMRVDGATEQEVADEMGVSQPTVNRRVRTRLSEIIAELDDPRVDHEVMPVSRPPRCLHCAKGDRVRLAALITERWVCAGRVWDPDRERSFQRWHTRRGDLLVDRPLARAAIGAAYDAVFVMGKDTPLERVAFRARAKEDLGPNDPHVVQWKRATEAAERREAPPQMEELPGVSLPTIEFDRERQTACCEKCLAPESRVRIVRDRRWPA